MAQVTVDPTGTAFNNEVYVWTEDQFSQLPTEAGQTFTMNSTLDAQWLFFDARYTTPILYEAENQPADYAPITATGTVNTASGNVLNFNEDVMSFSDARFFTTEDGVVRWVVKATAPDGENVFISNHGFARDETYTITDPWPGEGGFPAFFEPYMPDLIPQALPNADTTRAWMAVFRIDEAATPDSPLYYQNPLDTSDPGFMILNAYNSADVTYTDIDGGVGGRPAVGKVFTLSTDYDKGEFISFDNDNYINDGSAAYGNFINDTDQIGYYAPESDDAPGIPQQIYQAENGLVLEDEDGNLIKVAILSFGGTPTSQTDIVLLLTSSPLEPGREYQILQDDGTPGFTNPTFDLELSFQYRICFGAGTQIETQNGVKAIEELQAGDMVWTKDEGYQPIRWIGHSEVSSSALLAQEKLRPIRIRKGALGEAIPAEDLTVSPQHRMVVKSTKALRIEGFDTVLIAAKDLLDLDGVDVVESFEPVHYYHMLFDKHQIVNANGAESESLFTGPEALRAVGANYREELLALFPELADPEALISMPAASIVSGNRARKIVEYNKTRKLALQ